jgi:hypothetical protein
MLQIFVFLSIILVKRENTLILQDFWNDLQFGMEGVTNYIDCDYFIRKIF